MTEDETRKANQPRRALAEKIALELGMRSGTHAYEMALQVTVRALAAGSAAAGSTDD